MKPDAPLTKTEIAFEGRPGLEYVVAGAQIDIAEDLPARKVADMIRYGC